MEHLNTLKQKQHRKNSILQRNFHRKQEIQFLIFMQEYSRFSFSLWWIWQIDSIQVFSSNFLFFWMTNFSHSSMIVFKHVQLYETPFEIHKNEYFLTLTKTLKHEFSPLLYTKSRRQNENKKSFVEYSVKWIWVGDSQKINLGVLMVEISTNFYLKGKFVVYQNLTNETGQIKTKKLI